MAEKDKTDIANKINKLSGNKTESYYRTIFEQSPDGILVIDTNGKIIDFNEAACTHLGYSKEEFSKLSISDIDSSETPEETQERIKNTLKDGRAEFEVKHRTKKGAIRDVLVITQVMNLDGRIVLNSIWKDITERKKVEDVIRESQRQMATLLSNLNGMAYRCKNDSNWTMEFVSEGCKDLTEYEPADLIGNKRATYAELIHTDDRERIWEEVQIAIERRSPFQLNYRISTLAGKEKFVWEQGRAVFSDEGMLEALEGFIVDITDRKLAEEALRESEERYRLLVENQTELVSRFKPDGTFIFVNDVYYKFFGKTKDNLIGKKWHPLPVDEDLTFIQKELLTLSPTNPIVIIENRVFSSKGEIHWMQFINRGFFDLHGDLLEIQSVGRDITERKQAEEALRKEKTLSETVINSLPGIFYLFDENGHYLRWNTNYEIVSGYSSEEMEKMNPLDFFSGEEKNLVQEAVQKVFEKGESNVEANFISKDGRRTPYYFTGLRFISDNRHYLIGMGIDITDRKLAEEALYRSEAELHDNYFSQSAINMILSESLEDRPLEEVLQKALNMILSIPWLSFEAVGSIHLVEDEPDVLVMKAQYNLPRQLKKSCAHLHFGKCLCGKAALTQQIEFATHVDDSHDICYEGMAPHGHYVVPLLFGGKTLGVINIYLQEGHIRSQKEEDFLRAVANTLSGIIARKKGEEEKEKLNAQLLQSQKMEAVGHLAGGVAHDFNNILTAMIGYGHLLKIKLREEDPLRSYADHILSLSDKAANLTKSLLAFSRRQIINPRPVDLNEIISRIDHLLSRIIGEDIRLQTILSEKDLVVMADPGQIEQVLMNLAANARDAMPKGGLLTLRTETADIDHEYIREHGFGKEGPYVLLLLTDTGAGMDRETREKIFEPFFTTKEVGKGTGLGLSMVYGIIKQNEGYVTVDSEPGRGTTFRIYLPLIQAEAEEIRPEVIQPVDTGTETVLLAEDETAVREFTRKLLDGYGYKVIEAIDGQDAINKFKVYKNEIQLVLLDVIMPNKNGKEVYDEIKQIKPDIKVLFMSGYPADIIQKHDILEKGFAYIEKPASPTKLLRKIREVLNE